MVSKHLFTVYNVTQPVTFTTDQERNYFLKKSSFVARRKASYNIPMSSTHHIYVTVYDAPFLRLLLIRNDSALLIPPVLGLLVRCLLHRLHPRSLGLCHLLLTIRL